MGNTRANAAAAEPFAERLAIVGFVGDQFLGAGLRAAAPHRYTNCRQGRLSQLDLGTLGRGDKQPEGNAPAIHGRHELAALAPPSEPDSTPSLLGGNEGRV